MVHAGTWMGELSAADGFWPRPDGRHFLPGRPILDILLLPRIGNLMARATGDLKKPCPPSFPADGASRFRRYFCPWREHSYFPGRSESPAAVGFCHLSS